MSTAATTMVVDRRVPVPMRDGVVLYADVYRPPGSGRRPVILIRTAGVGGDVPDVHRWWFDPPAYVEAGYAVVVQNVRGTRGSPGRWRELLDDALDSPDAVAWAAEQPWSNGVIGMDGGAYHAAMQLFAAAAAPPSLRALAPMSGISSTYGSFAYFGGAFQLGQAAVSGFGAALMDAAHRQDAGEALPEGYEELRAAAADLWAVYRRLPLLESARISPWLDSHYGEWLRHPEWDEHWRPTDLDRLYPRIHTPALHISGWYDPLLEGTLENFQGLRATAATENARENQRLIVTPWVYTAQSDTVGELCFGPEASPEFVDLNGARRTWFDAFLKENRPPEGDRVRIFVMGANRWRSESDWPLTRAVPQRWFLRAGGRLSPEGPADEPPAEFLYDPRDPVPTVGGSAILAGTEFIGGPRDRRAVHSRPDVLLYLSDVLEEDLEATGPISVTLHVASSAPDTDFTASLLDVYRDGRAIGLTDGILRLRYRESFEKPRLLEPGCVYRIDVDLSATSNVFLAGHRIGVEISSSNFPRFDRNPNHGGVIAEAREQDLTVARQMLFQDGNRASFLTLPVVASP